MVIIGIPKDSDDKEFVKELSDALNLGIDEKKTSWINTENNVKFITKLTNICFKGQNQ